MASYREQRDRFPVLAQTVPGTLHRALPTQAPQQPSSIAYSFHVRYHHLKTFERPRLHVCNPNPNHYRAGGTGRCQLDETKIIPDLVIMISIKADLLSIKSLCAVNVRDGNRYEFQFHLHTGSILKVNVECQCVKAEFFSKLHFS